MAKLTAEEFQEKQARRLKASLQDMRAGINRVTVAPTMKAAQKLQKARENYIKAVDSGKMKRRLESVSLEEWKRKILDVGVDRVSAGIDAAKDKTIAFASELLPYQDALKAKVAAMPDGNIEDSAARVVAWMKGMHKFERKG